MTEYSHTQHLEQQIDRYLREAPYSEWAGFSIKQPDRRAKAVEWMAKQMRAIMALPDPPREYTADEYIAEFDGNGEELVVEIARDYISAPNPSKWMPTSAQAEALRKLFDPDDKYGMAPKPQTPFLTTEQAMEIARDPHGLHKMRGMLLRNEIDKHQEQERDSNLAERDPVITVKGRGYTRAELEEMSLNQFNRVMAAHQEELLNPEQEVVDSPICSCERFPSSCPVHARTYTD